MFRVPTSARFPQRATFAAPLFLCVVFSPLLHGQPTPETAENLKALIIDGQNNHVDWPKTTLMIKSYLEQSGRFTVDVARTRYTWQGGELAEQFSLGDGRTYEDVAQPKPDPEFAPQFAAYDVVISNFGYLAAPWPQATRESFVRFVREGGGFVVVHAANNCFGDWKEYNQIIGLGGWGGRNQASGPYLYLNGDGNLVRDASPGEGGSHGEQHEFQIVIRDAEHPITRGLPRAWMHSRDELYQQLRGPAENVTILATAYADGKFGGTERHEPMMMTVTYGDGRIYHTPMGHASYSMECVGFITTLVRGAEWAATGRVTVGGIPKDFPTAAESSLRAWKSQVAIRPE